MTYPKLPRDMDWTGWYTEGASWRWHSRAVKDLGHSSPNIEGGVSCHALPGHNFTSLFRVFFIFALNIMVFIYNPESPENE